MAPSLFLPQLPLRRNWRYSLFSVPRLHSDDRTSARPLWDQKRLLSRTQPRAPTTLHSNVEYHHPYQSNHHGNGNSHNTNYNWPQIGKGIDSLHFEYSHCFDLLLPPDISIYSPRVRIANLFHSNSVRSTPSPPPSPSEMNPLLASIPTPSTTNGYLVRGRVPYCAFVAVVRGLLRAWFYDAQLELVRCRTVVGAPLSPHDLDDVYPSASASQRQEQDSQKETPEEDGESLQGARENVWRRKPDGRSDGHVRLVMRWMFQGIPRHKIMYYSFVSPLSVPEPTLYEGVFIFQFDSKSGLIVEQRLQSMSPKPWIPSICRWWMARRAAREGGNGSDDGVPQLLNSAGFPLKVRRRNLPHKSDAS